MSSTTVPRPEDSAPHEHVVDPVPQPARPYQGRRAGVVSRLIANAVDFVIVALVVAGGYFGICAVLFLWSPSRFTFPDTSWTVLLVAAGTVSFVYLTFAWSATGRTYGDHLLGLRVVNFRGERVRFMGAVVRAAFCVVFPIGLFWALVSRANRSVQDVVLRTSVIYDWARAGGAADRPATR